MAADRLPSEKIAETGASNPGTSLLYEFVLGFVIALFLKETAPRKTGQV